MMTNRNEEEEERERRKFREAQKWKRAKTSSLFVSRVETQRMCILPSKMCKHGVWAAAHNLLVCSTDYAIKERIHTRRREEFRVACHQVILAFRVAAFFDAFYCKTIFCCLRKHTHAHTHTFAHNPLLVARGSYRFLFACKFSEKSLNYARVCT